MPLRRGKRDKQREQDERDEFVDAGADAGVDGDVDAGLGEPDGESDAATPSSVPSSEPAGARTRPFDETEVSDPEGGAPFPRLDLGSLRIPVFTDMEVRVELNEAQQPVAASLLHAGSAVQVLAFAAPRNDGIWDDVRAEIAESVRGDGGQVDEVDGPFGPELAVRVKGAGPDGKPVEQRLRFVGFDGPRWFLRAVFSGPAATNPQQALPLETVVTSVVVVRGDDPMAPRDALPLRLPSDVQGMPQAPGEERPTADPLTRGPEITETR
jgi:hypothetical protein